jgi:hypothetical protein
MPKEAYNEWGGKKQIESIKERIMLMNLEQETVSCIDMNNREACDDKTF